MADLIEERARGEAFRIRPSHGREGRARFDPS
jgi:hypothetical protein